MSVCPILSLLQKDVPEFSDRLLTFLESRIERPHGRPLAGSSDQEIYSHFPEFFRYFDEPQFSEIKSHVSEMQASVPDPPSGVKHDAGIDLAKFCYAWCRHNHPSTVIETGVGHGVTTAFILKALSLNQSGQLWSIDLPPLGAEEFAGCLVPVALRDRWLYKKGRSRRILPHLLKEAGRIDIFLHDSLHTARNMAFEFSSAWTHIRSGGLLISDDVGFFNHAFEDFIATNNCLYHAIHSGGYGIAIKE